MDFPFHYRWIDKTPVRRFLRCWAESQDFGAFVPERSAVERTRSTQRSPEIFLDGLPNFRPAVRLHGEDRVTDLPKATGGAEIAADSIDHPGSYIEMLFTAPAEGKRIAT